MRKTDPIRIISDVVSCYSHYALILFSIFYFLFSPVAVHADSLALTITPPFFQLHMAPGNVWRSEIKVVNTNATPLTVFASRAAFAPTDEEGHGRFIDVDSLAGNGDALANWIQIEGGPWTISPGGTAQIPFSITVPDNASPGGHYGAVLVGTEPSKDISQGSQMSVGTFISSLIFVRISGDVREEGSIREFYPDADVYKEPRANFTLRFENTGNTHLRPEGTIEIYNAWGALRGKLDVNGQKNFGYVLPQSSRKFQFEWIGDDSFFDIGRYKAVATLAYGENGRKNVTSTAYLWIIPWWRVALVMGGTAFFLFVIVFSIRRYVRRALSREMKKYGGHPPRGASHSAGALVAPLADGVLDLRKAYRASQADHVPTLEAPSHGFYARMFKKYRGFVVLFVLCTAGLIWIVIYAAQVLTKEKTFEINVQGDKNASLMQGE